LLGSVSMVMLLCARATGIRGGNSANVMQSTAMSDALGASAQVLNEVRCATGFSERTDKAITFTVADRSGDGAPETIRYAWSGVAGDPLTRSYNGGTATTVAPDVRALNFTYLLQDSGPPPPVESSEFLISSHNDALLLGSLKDSQLDKDSWYAEYFKPNLPADALSWKITRVKVMAKQNGHPDETFAAEIVAVDASGKPTTLRSVTVAETSILTSYSWIDINMGPTPELDPAADYYLLFRQISTSGSAAKLQREDGVFESDNRYIATSNGGGSWSTPDPNKHLRYYIYGTVTKRN
jgi:hypothetical protein